MYQLENFLWPITNVKTENVIKVLNGMGGNAHLTLSQFQEKYPGINCENIYYGTMPYRDADLSPEERAERHYMYWWDKTNGEFFALPLNFEEYLTGKLSEEEMKKEKTFLEFKTWDDCTHNMLLAYISDTVNMGLSPKFYGRTLLALFASKTLECINIKMPWDYFQPRYKVIEKLFKIPYHETEEEDYEVWENLYNSIPESIVAYTWVEGGIKAAEKTIAWDTNMKIVPPGNVKLFSAEIPKSAIVAAIGEVGTDIFVLAWPNMLKNVKRATEKEKQLRASKEND